MSYDTEREAVKNARLLADIALAAGTPVDLADIGARVRELLHEAGYHPGQVDDAGHLVEPPHDDDCAWCLGSVPGPDAAEPHPTRRALLADMAAGEIARDIDGMWRDGDGRKVEAQVRAGRTCAELTDEGRARLAEAGGAR